MSKVIFEEEQRFNQWWLLLIVIATAILIVVSVVGALWNYSDLGSILATIVGSLIAIAMIWMVFLMKLKTSITEQKINIHFYPFLKREWNWDDLKSATVLDYGFVGGWGIRLWTGMGTVYNVKGSKGLHIKTDTKEYVIGTQKEEELRSSIAHLLK